MSDLRNSQLLRIIETELHSGYGIHYSIIL